MAHLKRSGRLPLSCLFANYAKLDDPRGLLYAGSRVALHEMIHKVT